MRVRRWVLLVVAASLVAVGLPISRVGVSTASSLAGDDVSVPVPPEIGPGDGAVEVQVPEAF